MSNDLYRYFSRKECLKGREVYYPLTEEMESNLVKLLKCLNKLREAYGKPMFITSLYRPANINAAVGGAKKSNHLLCLACDFNDPDGKLAEWCMDNLDIIEECGLYLEHPSATKTENGGWLHAQCVSPKSGNRVFYP